MRTRKEHYRRKLPHFQQPGQSYFVTFILAGAMPVGAMRKYSEVLEHAKNNLQELELKIKEKDLNLIRRSSEIQQAQKEYQIAQRKYRLTYDKMLHKIHSHNFSLLALGNLKTIHETLNFWKGKRLHNHAWCIMSNHVHWVVSLFDVDKNNKPVYLEDILHSAKLFTARQINANENRSGQLWEHESFDTTIRNDKHFMNVVNYTIHNPVSAKLISNWNEWEGTYLEPELCNSF